MPEPAWTTLGCTSSGNCPQTAPLPGGGVALRSTRNPDAVVELDAGEWAALIAWVRDGQSAEPREDAPHA